MINFFALDPNKVADCNAAVPDYNYDNSSKSRA